MRWLDCSNNLRHTQKLANHPSNSPQKNVSFIDFARSTPLWPSVRNTLYVHIPSAFKQCLVFASSLSNPTFWIIGLDLGHCNSRYSYNFQGQGWWQSATSVMRAFKQTLSIKLDITLRFNNIIQYSFNHIQCMSFMIHPSIEEETQRCKHLFHSKTTIFGYLQVDPINLQIWQNNLLWAFKSMKTKWPAIFLASTPLQAQRLPQPQVISSVSCNNCLISFWYLRENIRKIESVIIQSFHSIASSTLSSHTHLLGSHLLYFT